MFGLLNMIAGSSQYLIPPVKISASARRVSTRVLGISARSALLYTGHTADATVGKSSTDSPANMTSLPAKSTSASADVGDANDGSEDEGEE